ncbi:acyl carrier protein [Streptomyces mirabilis]|uniref:acyl carrier protein n=1 Tax=Streptomyces mirabilis TaxID=68239 RepID=UPI0036C4AA4A
MAGQPLRGNGFAPPQTGSRRLTGRTTEKARPAMELGLPVSLVHEISTLWGEYLNGGAVEADDNFFELGGNSLIGIKIIERVSREYDVELSVRAFYLAQTPARVAELIEHSRG